MACAQLGLEPGPMGLAYLIPYKGEATLQVGYKGLLNLVWRSGQVASVQAEVVCEKDEFRYANGIPPELHHVPAAGDRGDVTHAYAVIGTTTGGWIFRVMTAQEIEEHAQRFSESYARGRNTPWKTDWNEMACKTVLKRTGKRAPLSAEAIRAVDLDDKAELGIPQELDVTPEAEADDAAPKALPEEAAEPERDPDTGEVIPDDVGREEREAAKS